MRILNSALLAILASAASALFGGCSSPSTAQTMSYPASLLDFLTRADEADSPISLEGELPLIAIPMVEEAQSLCEGVLSSGACPVIVPLTKDASALSSMAASWDGAIVPDGWVKEEDPFSVLFYRALCDRNVPTMGSSPLCREINEGLRRYNDFAVDVEELVRRASTYHHAKKLMDRIFTIDTHGDLPSEYRNGYRLGIRTTNQISLQKMEEGHLQSHVLVSFQYQGPLDKDAHRRAFAKCDGMIDQILEDVKANEDLCEIAYTPEDALRIKGKGKKPFFIGIENGYGLGDDLAAIQHFAERGVVYVTLCHMRDNLICHTSSRNSADTSAGLTPFGVQVVHELNRRGIIVDVSHTSSATFWDCIRESSAPIICSHSGASAIFRHNRNINDSQLRALAQKGGVIQVYMTPDFMGRDLSKVSLDDMMDHILHCIKVAGIDHVGIGCDFDGGGGGIGINGDNDMINITVRLLEAGLSEEDIEKIWGGNFLRVLSKVQAMAGR